MSDDNKAVLEAYTDERSIKDEPRVLKLVTDRFEIAKKYRQNFDTKFDKNYQYYRSYVKFDPEYWYRYQIFLPYIFAIIESITPDMVEAIIGSDEFFNIMGEGEEKPRAENMENLMRFQINEKMEFYRKVLMWIKSILIFGNGVMFNGWRKKTKTFNRREWHSFLGLNLSINRKITEDIVNDPFVDTVFIKNFYPQPHKETVKDCDWVQERAFKDYNFIRNLMKNKGLEERGIYKNLDKVKDYKPPPDFKNVMEEMNNLIGIATTTDEDPINKPIEILKYWTEDRLIMVVNRKVVIRDTDNPFDHKEIPYTDAKDYPLDKEFFAISDVDLLMTLNDICNDVTGYRLDNLVDQINQSYIAERGKGINPDDIISRPSGLIWSDDKSAIIPLRKNSIDAGAYNEPEVMYKTMQRVSGAWDYFQGATPERQETMGGIIRLQQAALKRFGYRIKLLQKTSFKNVLNQMMMLNQQLLPLKYPIFNKEGMIHLSPWDIAGKFRLQVSGSSNLVGLEERMMMIWREGKDDPYIDQPELRKRIIDILDLPNSEKLLVNTDNLLGAIQPGAITAGGVDPRLRLVEALKTMGR